jgi:hypothetical protein
MASRHNLLYVPLLLIEIPYAAHLLHRRSVPPMWLTARLTSFAFSRCDDEHSQAHSGVGV